MNTMKIEQFKRFEPLNEIDQAHVDSIKAAMLAGTFVCPPVLVWLDNDSLVTGSHRVVACDQLYREANRSEHLDAPEYAAIMGIEIPVLDVSDIMEAIEDVDDFQYDNLSAYFGGTWVEPFAKTNKEW